MYDECPVCGDSYPSELQDICHSCGIQFGYNDHHPDYREGVHEAWRLLWVDNGRRRIEGAQVPTLAQLMERLEHERRAEAEPRQ